MSALARVAAPFLVVLCEAVTMTILPASPPRQTRHVAKL